MKTYAISLQIFALFLFSLTSSVIQAESAADIKDYSVSRYNFQKSTPKVAVEHLLVDRVDAIGTVSGSYLQAAFLRDGDLVYLKLNNPAVSVGDQFMICNDSGPVPVPGKYGQTMGRDLLIKGYAEATKVTEHAVVAKIFNASMNISIGDLILSTNDVSFTIEPKEPSKMIRGKVLRSAKNLGLIGAYDFVYLNRGEKDGMQLNDRLYVYRTAEGVRTIDKNRPAVNIGELVIVHMGDHVSTAYVLSAEDSFNPGSFFKSAISEVKFLADKPGEIQGAEVNKQESDAEAEDAEQNYQVGKVDSYFSFGPGVAMEIDKKGVHKPHLSLVAEYGFDQFAFPLSITIYRASSIGFTVAPRYQLEFRTPSLPHWIFRAGAGPYVDYTYDNVSGAKSKTLSMGLETIGLADYFLSDSLFVSIVPAALDLRIWQTQWVNASTESKVDMGLRWSVFAALGYTF